MKIHVENKSPSGVKSWSREDWKGVKNLKRIVAWPYNYLVGGSRIKVIGSSLLNLIFLVLTKPHLRWVSSYRACRNKEHARISSHIIYDTAAFTPYLEKLLD